jgi:hypothetical protein
MNRRRLTDSEISMLTPYIPREPAWLALLGHELVHVGQYRNGMTALSYLCAAVLGYRRNRYEQEAYAVQSRILEDLRVPGVVQPS